MSARPGEATLLKFAANVDTDRIGSPAVLGVITVERLRPDETHGVVTIPIGTLGPCALTRPLPDL